MTAGGERVGDANGAGAGGVDGGGADQSDSSGVAGGSATGGGVESGATGGGVESRADRGGELLRARYRRLLLCYPRDYRRRHADDLLTTMVEAAGGRRTRPTVREAANLIGHGLRARAGRPASRTVLGWVLVAALLGGLVGGALGVSAAWLASPLPGKARTEALFREAVPMMRPAYVAGPDVRGGALLRAAARGLGVGEYDPVTVGTLRTDVGTLAAGLRGSGWSVGTPQPGGGFTARRGDLELTAGGAGTDTWIELRALPPWTAWPAGIVGALLGAGLTFLTVAWAARRTGPGHPAHRAANVFFGLALVLCGAPVLARVSRLRWDWLDGTMLIMVGVVGAVAALGGLALATIPGRGERERGALAG